MSSDHPAENTAENPETPPTSAAEASPSANAEDEEILDINTGCLREVAVEIPADVVNREFDTTVQRYTKVARVPGFRKGKVPASVVRNRFAQEIKSDVLESLLPRYFREVVTREGFRPISEPQVHSLVDEPGQPLRFKAAFEILPDIQLGDYQNMKLAVPEVAVADEELDAELKRLQEQHSSFDPVEEERPLRDGDFAQISFQAVSKEVPSSPEQTAEAQTGEVGGAKPDANQPVTVDEVFVEIGGKDTLPEFTEHLRGAKPGEERNFDVTYPGDYYDTRLAGKTLAYTAKVNALKKKTTPELTDEFAKELNQEFQTLDDLKNRLRNAMLSDRQQRTLHDAREKLLTELTESHNFPVPETMIQKQIDSRLERWLRSLAAQGMRTEDMKRMDFKRLRRSQREGATRDVKANLLLSKIAEAENLEATDEEVNQEVHLLAQQAGETPEAIHRKLEERGALESIRARIRNDKAFLFLYNKSTSNAQNGAVQE